MSARLSLARLTAAGLCILVLPSVARAHTPDSSTARITLRDGHAELQVDVDILELIAKGGTNARDATSLATARDDTLAEYVAETRRVFETEARLDADGSPVEITLRTFPTPPEVRMRAAQASATHEDHPGRVQLRFESSASLLEARILAVTLPRSLGPVLVTFVQPSTRLAATTGPAQFVVLGAPRIISTSDAAPPTTRAWAAAAACALALLGLLAPIWTRRRALALERRAGSSPKHSGRPSLTVPPSLK